VEVDDVELVGTPPYLIEHQDIVRHRFFDGRIQSERYVTAAHEFRLCDGISRGEQSDIAALPDKFLGQVRDDPFGASIEFGGNAFRQRCYLGDLHRNNLLKRAKHRQ